MIKIDYTDDELKEICQISDKHNLIKAMSQPTNETKYKALEKLLPKYNKAIEHITKAAEHRAMEYYKKNFDELFNDLQESIEQQTVLIKSTIQTKDVNPSAETFFVNFIKENIFANYGNYFEYIKNRNAIKYQEIMAYLDEVVSNPIYYEFSDVPRPLEREILQAIITNYPREYISPTDKVSQKAFEGVLNKTDLQAIAMERRGSSREINTLASINFDDLGGEVQIKGTELNAYDRVVHDAITTLYIEGGNKIMTPRMIYQAMTGNPDAILTNVSADQISDSLTKLLYSQVVIKADDDIQQYGHKSFTYDGALIAGERITAKVNGQRVNECIHLFREPILYEYANKKNQIGRIPIKLLNSPINNNREIIILKDYLKNRILAMKGGNLSRVIVYSTVFNKIGIEAATQGALRKKESKTRDQIKRILGYWKNENFIAGYKENKKGGLIYSVTVDVNK